MYDAIFLTTPSSLFADVNEAKRCARALLAKAKYFCEKENISDTTIEVCVSNVNPRKAQYVRESNGVGRPQKVLSGDLKNCFVCPHLHLLITGNQATELSTLIIRYFIKRYKSLKDPKHGVRIWKKYVLKCDIERVRKYIWIQSVHFLTYKSKKSDYNDKKTKKRFKKRIINVRIKHPSSTTQNIFKQDSYNKNYILLCNLKAQWSLLQWLKRIAVHKADYTIIDKLVILQKEIESYGNMINANIDVASLYFVEIANIIVELEKLRQYTFKNV